MKSKLNWFQGAKKLPKICDIARKWFFVQNDQFLIVAWLTSQVIIGDQSMSDFLAGIAAFFSQINSMINFDSCKTSRFVLFCHVEICKKKIPWIIRSSLKNIWFGKRSRVTANKFYRGSIFWQRNLLVQKLIVMLLFGKDLSRHFSRMASKVYKMYYCVLTLSRHAEQQLIINCTQEKCRPEWDLVSSAESNYCDM